MELTCGIQLGSSNLRLICFERWCAAVSLDQRLLESCGASGLAAGLNPTAATTWVTTSSNDSFGSKVQTGSTPVNCGRCFAATRCCFDREFERAV